MKTRLGKYLPLFALINVLFFVLFGRIFTDPGTLISNDFWDDHWTLHLPNQMFFDASVHSGTFPFWNPYTFTGQPFSGNPAALIFYPPNIVRSLLNSDPTPYTTLMSLAWSYLFHVNVLGIGMYALARKLDLTRTASYLAALLPLTFGTSISSAYQHHVFLYVVAWVPCILFGLLIANASPSTTLRARWSVGAGLVYGIQILTGVPQVIIIATIVYIIFAYTTTLLYPDEKITRLRALIRTTCFLALFGLTGALCASAVILPTIEFSQWSSRGEAGSEGLFVGLSLVLGAIKLLAERQQILVSKIRYVAYILSMLVSCQISFIALLLYSPFRARRRPVILMAVLFYTIFDCSMGTPFPVATLVNAISPFVFAISSYSKVLLIVPTSILVAIGFDSLSTVTLDEARSSKRFFFILVIMLIFLPFSFHEGSIHGQPVDPMPLLPQNPLMIILPVLAFSILLTVSRRNPMAAAWCIVVLGFMEAGIWNHGSTADPSPRKDYERLANTPMPIEPSNQRILAVRLPNINVLKGQENVTGYDSLQNNVFISLIRNPGEDDGYLRALNSKDISRNSFVPLFLKRKFWLSPSYVHGALPEKGALFPPTSVAYLADPESISVPRINANDVHRSAVSGASSLIDISDSKTWSMVRDSDTKKIAMATSRIFELPNKHKALRIQLSCESALSIKLHAYEFVNGERKETYYAGPFEVVDNEGVSTPLEWPLPDYDSMKILLTIEKEFLGKPFDISSAEILVDTADEGDRIQISHFDANTVGITVSELNGPRILSFASVYFPGWEVSVDSEPARLLTVNDIFMGVEIPQGSHTVEFKYAPRVAYAGIGISLTTLIVAVIFILPGLLPRRN